MYKTSEKQRACVDKYQQSHREQGLCSLCPRPVVLGQTRCFTHLQGGSEYKRKYAILHKERIREYKKKWKAKMKAEGRCTTCSMPLGEQDEGRVTCVCCITGLHVSPHVPHYPTIYNMEDSYENHNSQKRPR